MKNRLLTFMINRLYLSKQSRRCRPWKAIKGDQTLRLDYPLTEHSIAFDLGGFKGQWASDIFSMYCCEIYVFEPVKTFYESIKKRFNLNKKIKTFPFGLGVGNMEVSIGIESDRSSILKIGSRSERIHIHDFKEFLQAHSIGFIDLMKVNIEGAEYDLLDFILARDLQTCIGNIQVQFHDFFPDAENRMKIIQEKLAETHDKTWAFPLVWENWKLRKDG